MKLYKCLLTDGTPAHGGSGKWSLPKGRRPGKWMPFIENIELCERGYHLCRTGDLVVWLSESIYIAEYRGKMIHSNNKVVVQQARLVRKLDAWNERTARLFAADCAEHVLHLFEEIYPNDDRPRKAIETARNYANGTATREELVAAWDAAWAAVRVAAWDAARAAAWAAARVAARVAARDAAWDAARTAAWAAAWAAARDAARVAARTAEIKWQTERLFEYLEVDA